jgi:hypothetical protein
VEDETLELEGTTPAEIYRKVVAGGVSRVDASLLVSSWIFENFGRTRRVFDYRQDFPAIDEACKPAFARSFAHEDWTDGESVVQAEQSAGEDGFNVRFHRIEADLDNLAADARVAIACLVRLRQEVRTLLDELRAEINRINADLFELERPARSEPGVRVPPYVEMLEQPSFLGTATIGDEDRYMWRTPQGVMMLPAQHTIGIGPDDRRVKYAGRLAEFVQQTKVREAFPEGTPVTKAALVERFGNELTEDGVLVKQLVEILPDDAEFGGLDDVVLGVAERNAAAIRTSPATRATVTNALGIAAEGVAVAEVGLENLKAVPANARVALARGGIETIGGLADATPESIVEAARADGVELGIAEAANLRGIALTLRGIR